MATIEVTIRDNEGKVISNSKRYPIDIGKGTLAEIEGAVEKFKNVALPEIEGELFSTEQTKFSEEQKKTGIINLTGQQK